MSMLLKILPEEIPGPENFEEFLIGQINETENKITHLEYPLELFVTVENYVMSFSVQRDFSGIFLLPIEESSPLPL